ncbi:MAG: class I SAM-dependent methyltransferase [Fimbriimonas sp.]
MTPLHDVPLYYKGLRQEVRAFLPERFGTLLDVGCGAGSFGLNLKSDFGAEVWGIEIVDEMAKLAAERLDHALSGDCMELIPTLPEGHFDVVTYTDVLEHLVRPDLALEATKRILKPEGVVVASLPNLRYWPAFKRLLLDADFPQEDSGIFDRTHLRFFTEKSMRQLFEENGWEVIKMGGVNAYVSIGMRVANVLAMRKLRDMKFLQYVIVARPKR